MTTLGAALDSTAVQMRIDAAVSDPADYYQIDDEVIQLLSDRQAVPDQLAGDRTLWRVERGVSGTTPASHLNGATLTPLYPQIASSAVETAGFGVTVDNTVDPPFAATTIKAPGAVESTPGTAFLLPVGAYVRLGTNVTLNAGDVVPYDTVNFDPLGYWNALTRRFVIPTGRDGLHLVGQFIKFNASASDGVVSFSIVNSGNDANPTQSIWSDGSNATFAMMGSLLINAVAGDQLIPGYEASSGVASVSLLGGANGSGMWIMSLGPPAA